MQLYTTTCDLQTVCNRLRNRSERLPRQVEQLIAMAGPACCLHCTACCASKCNTAVDHDPVNVQPAKTWLPLMRLGLSLGRTSRSASQRCRSAAWQCARRRYRAPSMCSCCGVAVVSLMADRVL